MVEFLKELVKNAAFVSACTTLLTLILFNVGLAQEMVNAVVGVVAALLAALGAYLAARVVRAQARLLASARCYESFYSEHPNMP